ncbi:threonine-rich GPI-anchored glycoprotein, partial [Clarias magur]
ISNSSYAVIFTISIDNISIPENPELSDDTYIDVENFINNAINTLLNAPGAEPFVPNSSNFTTSEKLINGNIEYSFQNGDAKTPISLLSQLNMICGSALVQARLLFNTSSVDPSDTSVINAITNLLNTRLQKLSESLNVLNFTFEDISDISSAVTFTINISNISIPGNPEFWNNTYYQVESIITNALSIILGDAINSTLRPQIVNLMNISNQIVGEMLYNIQGENIQLYANGLTPSNTGQVTSLPPPVGTVLIYIHLLFKNLSNVPSEADVIKAANALLDSSIRLARDTETVKVYNPVSIQNVTYQKLADNSYNIGFGFKISNVSISSNNDQLNETYDAIQNTINGLLNRILNSPNSKQFIFPRASYMSNSTTIVADSEYVFSEGDLNFVPSGFLAQILIVSGLSSPPAPTEEPIAFNTELLATPAQSGFPEWALAIIIPCIIAIVLIPCWIILC